MTRMKDHKTPPDIGNRTELPTLTIDWERYGRYLEDSDLSEEDKRAFIEALWSIIVSFVDMGFGINPVQEICGEVEPLKALDPDSASDVVQSEHSNSKTAFKKSADGSSCTSREGSRQ